MFTVLRFYAFMNFCLLCINCSLHGNESVKSTHEQSVDNIRDVQVHLNKLECLGEVHLFQ